MDQALNSQKTPHTSPLRASYGMSFVSILMKNDRVIKGFYCRVRMILTLSSPMLNSGTRPFHGSLARYAKLRVRMRRECRERFPRHRR